MKKVSGIDTERKRRKYLTYKDIYGIR